MTDWLCLRCGESRSPERRGSVTFHDVSGTDLGMPLAMCTHCAATIRACLERGTGLTPIVWRAKKKAADPLKVFKCDVGPCSCGVFYTREEFERHQAAIWKYGQGLFARGVRE
jgi:hypothetical protein